MRRSTLSRFRQRARRRIAAQGGWHDHRERIPPHEDRSANRLRDQPGRPRRITRNRWLAGGCGNLLQTFVDLPAQQDAWEIKFDEKSWDLKQPESVKVVESGPERAVVRINEQISKLHLSSRRDRARRRSAHRSATCTSIGTRTTSCSRLAFPSAAQSEKATFEIPYGTIQRPTTRHNSDRAGQFEVPALRWGDISNDDAGLQPAQRQQVWIRCQRQRDSPLPASLAQHARAR